MKGRKAGIFLACSLLAAVTGYTGIVYGATGIDVEKTDCKLTFTLDADKLRSGEQEKLETLSPGYREYYRELSEALDTNPITVELYRVAEVDVSGTYSLLAGYTDSDALSGIESADAQTTAQEWSVWAEAAAEIAASDTPDQTAMIQKDAAGKAYGTAEDLKTGMYLVNVAPVETSGFIYHFIPYLVSLPNHYAYDGGSDEWIYGDGDTPVIVGLKPEREDRYGTLIIEKQLTSYHETLEGAAFVYEIRAVKEDTLVYSDVVALNFDAPGRQSLTIEGIPAGAEVTVTEIYAGAGYQAVGGTSRAEQVRADQSVTVSFENEYNGRLNGGGPAVVNHFVYEKDAAGSDNLTWEKQ